MEQCSELKAADERLKKATVDAAKFAEDLRLEQEQADQAERARRVLEGHVKELQVSSFVNIMEHVFRLVYRLIVIGLSIICVFSANNSRNNIIPHKNRF